ncbi:MAG: M1 family metallopeptidase, partial [Candidatus Acidiferrales bacterium]
MWKLRSVLLLTLLACSAASGLAQSPGQPQGPGRPIAPVQAAPTALFRATNYEVRASLDAVGQVMNATAKVDFVADAPASVVEVELNPNLRVNTVVDAGGKPLSFDRDDDANAKLHVELPDAVPAWQKVTLTFEYGGPLSSRIPDPAQRMRLAYMGKDGGYLLLPSRWFPLTAFPSNRYTGIFRLEVPGNMVVVGTGESSGEPVSVTPRAAAPAALGNTRSGTPVSLNTAPAPPPLENERMLYTFRVDKPEAAGTFVIAPLQLSPVRAEGMSFSVYTPPAAANTSQKYADAIANILDFFNGEFGALPEPGLKIAQLPDGTVDGFSAPGVLLISAHDWRAQPNTRLLANLAAQQWWGNQVMAASKADVWITDGLARYSEGLYAEDSDGKEALNKALQDFAVGALMFDDAPPIAEAGRLRPDSEEYDSVVVNKGAMVFHMLRAIIGDSNFTSLLKEFYSRYAGKTASIPDFEQSAEAHAAQPAPQEFHGIGNAPVADTAAPNLKSFFAQWLHSSGIPEFSLDYVVYRTRKGFRIVGKVKQDLDVFHMNVEMEVETEGNPEFKTVDVSGKESPFSVETFGRPKPNGIILDPHNYILKSSQPLRVRAIIARGETLAEQGRYYDAVQQYQRALEQDHLNA